MKKFLFGIFNLITVVFFLIFCISGSLCLGKHWDFFVDAYRSGNTSQAIVETLFLSFFACFLIAAVGFIVSATIYIFCLFREKNNPWRHLVRAGKKAFAFIWEGTFWSRIWLYIWT